MSREGKKWKRNWKLAFSRVFDMLPYFGLWLLHRWVSGWTFLFAAEVFLWNLRETGRRDFLSLGARKNSYFYTIILIDHFWAFSSLFAWSLGRVAADSAAPFGSSHERWAVLMNYIGVYLMGYEYARIPIAFPMVWSLYRQGGSI